MLEDKLMKAIKCELCGSNQLIKKDGYFQCEYCETKYTLEEARKLIGSVEIKGDVSVKEADFIVRAGVLEKYNGSDETVVIPENVKIIGDNAFSGCIGLTGVVMHNNLTQIGQYAFFNCSSLTIVTIPESVESIGHFAFKDCSKLLNVNLSRDYDVECFEGTPYLDRLEEVQMHRRRDGVCQYCGGDFEGLLYKKCINCHKPKDY
jgi:hypothetical protein